MASKLSVLLVIASSLVFGGCGSSGEDAVVQEGPKASDLKEVGGTVDSGAAPEASPAKGARNPKARDGR